MAAEQTVIEFEYSDKTLENEVTSRIANGETNFQVIRELKTDDATIGNEVTVHIWVDENKITSRAAKATKTINWALSGRYYVKSSNETISNYGNHGSVDYNGSTLSNAVWDVYHDVTYKYSGKYKATATASTSEVTDGSKFLGKYRLKNLSTNAYAADTSIYIIVKKDGSWSTKGNYSAINVD